MNQSNLTKTEDCNCSKNTKQSQNEKHEQVSTRPRMSIPMLPFHLKSPLTFPKILTPNHMINQKRPQPANTPNHTEKHEEVQQKNHTQTSIAKIGGRMPQKVKFEKTQEYEKDEVYKDKWWLRYDENLSKFLK